MAQSGSLRTALLMLATLLLPSQPAVAQQGDTAAVRRMAEQRLGRPISNAEILQRIQNSGLSREEAKARLRLLGHDPAMVDPYYDALEEGAALPQGSASREFAAALEQLNRAPRVEPGPSAPPDTVPEVRESAGRDSLNFGGYRLPLFGRELFAGVTSEFQPVLYGPVDPGYRVGPGDEILLVLTGGVEAAYDLEVNRQGQVVIPDVGQLPVSGKTIGELEQTLHGALGRVYSGVRGPEPSIRFQVSLGRLRTNQVYIVGEVERPGAYQVSGVASVFNALYTAGGPNLAGSFRNIQVWRRGTVVSTVDLYDYLVSGDGGDEIRLENGDRIHVPLAGMRAAIRGAVRREAVYELKQGERLEDLLRYAGGFKAEAVVRRVQVDRILPPLERRPGADRVLVDVDVVALLAGEGEAVPLQDGDVVEVFGVSGERRNRVSISGDVRRPGTYEWIPGSTLWGLISRAEGLGETAFTPRAHVLRLNEETGTRRLIGAALELDSSGRPLQDLLLADRDSVVIFSREELATAQNVHIAGYVKNPGTYTLAEGMTLKDLILAAGGFTEAAHTADAEVARVTAVESRSDTTARVLHVPLAAGQGQAQAGQSARLLMTSRGTGSAVDEMAAWHPQASDFELRNDDRVFIRRAPGYETPGVVVVTGEVAFPGEYVLSRRQERLTDLLERVGGLTPEAYVPGIRIIRGGNLVAVDSEQALRDPGSPANLVLEAGDSLQVSSFDPTVLVQGAVNFEARVLHRPGAGLEYYISQAGGYGEHAARERVSITHQNGERATVRPFLMMRRSPRITPGSVIVVPTLSEAERRGINFAGLVTTTLSAASVTATLLLAISQLNR